jgi:hypothetical protein
MLVVSAIGLIVLLLVLFTLRRKPILEAAVPGEDWQATDEVVRDDATGRTLRVWIDPADGKRYSVAELR